MSGKKSVFLEVDSTAFEKNLLIRDDGNEPNDLESIINSLNQVDDGPWKLVTPSPGMVIKTWDIKGEKVFINLCTADEIPEPKDLTESELLELWQSDEITDYKVPLSMMEPHEELDKSGKKAFVYDVAVNTNFFGKIKENQVFWSFLVQVIQEGLENKFNIELKKEEYVMLKNRNSIGDLKPHRIRSSKKQYQPPKPLIEELPSSGTKKVEEPKKSKDTLNYRLLEYNNILLAQFHLPNTKSSAEVKLDVGPNRIIVESGKDSVDLFFPYKVENVKANAHFNRNSKILNVFMPRHQSKVNERKKQIYKHCDFTGEHLLAINCYSPLISFTVIIFKK